MQGLNQTYCSCVPTLWIFKVTRAFNTVTTFSNLRLQLKQVAKAKLANILLFNPCILMNGSDDFNENK